MLDSLAPVHSTLSARATREQRKRGEIVEVPKNAVERPRHSVDPRGSKEASEAPSTAITAAAYPPYTEEETGAAWAQGSTRARASTGGGYDYPSFQTPTDTQSVVAESSALTSGEGPGRRPGSSAGYPTYPTYFDGPTHPRPLTSETGPPKLLGYPYRSLSAQSHPTTGGHYAESEPPGSGHSNPPPNPPESPMYTAPPPPVPQPNWSSPPPTNHYSSHQHEQRSFYHPTPTATPDGFSYAEHNHPAYGPPPPGSSGSAYGYPTPTATTGYYGHTGSSQYTPVATPTTTNHPSGYSVSSVPSTYKTESPYGYPPPNSNSTAPLLPPAALPSTSETYQYPPKRRLEEDTDSSGPNSSGYNTRKIPRSSLSLGLNNNQPIRALQEPAGGDDDALWFPPTTERRSSLAISALLGSPQADNNHKPRMPWDGGSVTNAPETGAGNGGGNMEEKAKALLGSAH